MATVTHTFDAAGAGNAFSVEPGQSLAYASVGDAFAGIVKFQRSLNGGLSWETVQQGAADADISGTVKNETPSQERYRFVVADTDGETPVDGETVTTIADVDDVLRALSRVVNLTDEGITVSGVLATSRLVIFELRTMAADAAGSPGQIETDGDYIYVCTESGVWKRAALTTEE
jgi:hypothetical protein